jgi:microcystin-dependent protein
LSQPYLGEIRMVSASFAPEGWALCDGQLIAISGNEELFALLRTTYGGDGQTNFALPDLRGRIPVHRSAEFPLGTMAGSEEVTLTSAQIAKHSHPLVASLSRAVGIIPAEYMLGQPEKPLFRPEPGAPVAMAVDSIWPIDEGGLAHSNLQPFLCINFIIALAGVPPSRN